MGARFTFQVSVSRAWFDREKLVFEKHRNKNSLISWAKCWKFNIYGTRKKTNHTEDEKP
jgi:hypothetical protein